VPQARLAGLLLLQQPGSLGMPFGSAPSHSTILFLRLAPLDTAALGLARSSKFALGHKHCMEAQLSRQQLKLHSIHNLSSKPELRPRLLQKWMHLRGLGLMEVVQVA